MLAATAGESNTDTPLDVVFDSQHIDLSRDDLMESRVENHSRSRASQTDRFLSLGNAIQRPRVAEEVGASSDQSRCASESSCVQPRGGEALEEARRADVGGENDARVGRVDGGEVAVGLGYGVVEQVKRVGGVGGLALCFDGAGGLCGLLGGELDDELADGRDLVGDLVPLAVVEVGGGSAEDGVAGRCEDEGRVGEALVELRGGLGLLGLRCCHGLCYCCWTWRWCRGGESSCAFDPGGFEGNAGALLLVAGVLCVVHASALAAECRVVALGDGVAVVEALGTDDDAELAHCWLVADGGLVAYRVASLAVVVFCTRDGKTTLFEVGVALLQECSLIMLEVLLLMLVLSLLLLLRRLLKRLRLRLLLLLVVVLVVLVGRVFSRPLVGRVTTGCIGVGSFAIRVHVTLLIGLGVLRVDLRAIVVVVVHVDVAGITITI